MIQALFDYPLPNHKGRYDLSEKELTNLLQSAYDNGFKTATELNIDTIAAKSENSYNWFSAIRALMQETIAKDTEVGRGQLFRAMMDVSNTFSLARIATALYKIAGLKDSMTAEEIGDLL